MAFVCDFQIGVTHGAGFLCEMGSLTGAHLPLAMVPWASRAAMSSGL
jgi:hypothetical protein